MLSRAFLVFSLSLTVSIELEAQTLRSVSANVLSNGNPPTISPIGTLRISDGRPEFVAEYIVGNGSGFLWDWYEFRWVVVEVQRVVDGVVQGNSHNGQRLAAIQPPMVGATGGDDHTPWSYDNSVQRSGLTASGEVAVDRSFLQMKFIHDAREPAPNCASCALSCTSRS